MLFYLLIFFNIINFKYIFNQDVKFQLTEIGLRHIDSTETLVYEKQAVENAILFEKTTLFMTYFSTEFYDVKLLTVK